MQSRVPANFRLDVARARQVAAKLQEAYRTTGIFGTKEMPEDMLPAGVTPGSEEHLRFSTLTVAIDYQRDADQLWAAARLTSPSPSTSTPPRLRSSSAPSRPAPGRGRWLR